MFREKLTLVIAALFSSAKAHFFISNPSPIPGSAIKDPLSATGADFPCHGVDLSRPTNRTAMAVGSNQPLGFELANGANTAVHGGGSCQISITYEVDPVKVKDPANWRVIKSFLGGCPTDATGNLNPKAELCNGSNSPNCVNNLSFSIPSQVRNGNATLAWTWFNNVGNREMYMNCAAVSFTGGLDQLGSLPVMFIANLNIFQCSTTENFNTNFPDPGEFLQIETTLNYPLKLPVGPGCGPGSGVGSNGPTDVASKLPTSSNMMILPNIITITTSYANPTAIPERSQMQVTKSNGDVRSSTCQSDALPCSLPGFSCINDNMYIECAFGCGIPMKIPAGTECVDDAIKLASSGEAKPS